MITENPKSVHPYLDLRCLDLREPIVYFCPKCGSPLELCVQCWRDERGREIDVDFEQCINLCCDYIEEI